MIRVLFIVALAIVCCRPVVAQVAVNEALANEPGDERSLEWLELYNNGSAAVNLSVYSVAVSGSYELLIPLTMPAQSFLVVCRDSIRFEQHFGDSSGVWGDSPEENYLLIEPGTFILANALGVVVLKRAGLTVDSLGWIESGQDGTSWERKAPDSTSILQSIDPSGSTPGRINSHAPAPVDLAVEAIDAVVTNGITVLTCTIINRGLTDVTAAVFTLYYRAGDSLGDVLLSGTLDDVTIGETLYVETQHQFLGEIYMPLAAVLQTDDRPNNNRLDFTAPGESFPPLVLSEMLVNPTGAINSEWVEVKNVSGQAVDLQGWRLGDSLTLAEVSAGSVVVPPDSYAVFTQNELVFRGYYDQFDGILVAPSLWPALNNSGDAVRLVDGFGLEADRFSYANGFDDNYTWGRSETADETDRWGRSEDTGGTPGTRNRIRLSTEGENNLSVSLEPQIISPNGDGRDDSVAIRIRAPEASAYTLRIYDAQGRPVKTFEADAPDLADTYVWYGVDDTGNRLPIGMYILYFDASGVQSIKKTVVIAR